MIPYESREGVFSDCCPLGQRLLMLDLTSTTKLEFDTANLSSREEVLVWLEERPPEWFVVVRNPRVAKFHIDYLSGDIHTTARVPAKFCPFCGAVVPVIERNLAPPEPLMMPLEAGYCSTCSERTRNCCCWPLQHLWRIKG